MRVRCPHCHTPIEVVDDSSLAKIDCPSCGSCFSLIADETTKTYHNRTRHIAQFELVRELGIGKFGSVWMARDNDLDRTVAIKIPRKGSLDPEEAEKFLRDARAAAQLRHPNIVSVHEVGRQDETVYIVTDYIDGVNLRQWLSAQRPSFRESADLMIKVAQSLEHAHRAGVVHRDLKPGNIMLDRDLEPHVIDFGLARREQGEVTMTVDGHLVGTPAYMSPEQARGAGHAADRRSDVYSLGVILFELLTGELPFRGETQMLLFQIQRDEPPRPRKLNARIPRDLETITLKCLEKEPTKRYQTAAALADDLRHWRRGEPILARPVGSVERGWRWCRRNPSVASLATAATLALVSGTAVSAYFAVQAGRRAGEATLERHHAEQSFNEAQAAAKLAELRERAANSVSQFLIALYEEPTPYKIFGIRLGNQHVNAASRTLLERGAEELVEGLNEQPLIKASLLTAIGRAYHGTGRVDKAAELFEQALAIRRAHLPPADAQVTDVLLELGTVYCVLGRNAEAETVLRENVALRQSVLGESHEDVVSAKAQLALLLGITHRNVKESERIWREVLASRRAMLSPDDPRIGEALLGLGGVLLWSNGVTSLKELGRSAEALAMVTESARILASHDATRDVGMAINGYQRSVVMYRLGRTKAAMDAGHETYRLAKAALGSDHPITVFMTSDLARGLFSIDHGLARPVYEELFTVYQNSGICFHFLEAERKEVEQFAILLREAGEESKLESILRAVLARQKELTKYRSSNGAAVLAKVAQILVSKDRTDEANALVDDYLATSNLMTSPPESSDSHQLSSVAALCESLGRLELAAALFDKWVSASRSKSLDCECFADILASAARVYFGLKQFDKSEARLREALASYDSAPPDDPADVIPKVVRLAESVDHQGRAAEAERLFADAADRAARLPTNRPKNLTLFLLAHTRWASSLAGRQDWSGAQRALHTGVEHHRKHGSADAQTESAMLKALVDLGRIQLRLGKSDEAKELFEEVVTALEPSDERDETDTTVQDAREELAKLTQRTEAASAGP